MSDERDPGVADDGEEEHVDAISEVEAEADAGLSVLDDLAHRPHVHRHDHEVGVEPAASRPPIAPDTIGSAPAPNHRAGRQRFLVTYLRVALVAAFVIGVLELILPEDTRDEAAIVMVVVFVAAPIGRVLWLMIRWVRLGDWRYALVGAALLGVVATGFLVR